MNTFQNDGLSILLRVIGRISEDNDSVVLLDSVIESYFIRSTLNTTEDDVFAFFQVTR